MPISDATLTTAANVIKNETGDELNTATRVGQMFVDIVANKVNSDSIDTDGTLTANSDTKLASQKAVKTYIAANSGGSVLTDKISVSSAEILALNGTPKILVAAPGAGKIIQPIMYLLVYTYGTATYAINTTAQIYYNGVSSAGVVSSSILNRTESFIQRMGSASTTAFSFAISTADITNKALIMDMQAGNPTTGDGSLDVYVSYLIVTL